MISWWCYNINIIDILLRDGNVFKSLFHAITGTGTTIRRTTDFWGNKKTVVHNFQYFFQINSRKGQKELTLALLIRASLSPAQEKAVPPKRTAFSFFKTLKLKHFAKTYRSE